MRFFIDLSYNGKHYHGWQRQKNAISVQETLEACFQQLYGRSVDITGAGRTDTGVHARQLIAHFDLEEELDTKQLIYKLNRMLPPDMVINEVYPVRADAHARFDAEWREYQYFITRKKNPFLEDFAAFIPQKINCKAMNEACPVLLKHHDFQCFSKVKTDVKTYNSRIETAYWQEIDDRLIFTIKADRFLRNMIRAIVGTLLEIGMGKITKEDLEKIILSKNRSNAGKSAAAKGLFLNRIGYPKDILIK